MAGVAKWLDDNKGLEMVENLTRKSTIIAQSRSEKMRQTFLKQMVKDYIGGQVVLGRLELELPEVYENVIRRKAPEMNSKRSVSQILQSTPRSANTRLNCGASRGSARTRRMSSLGKPFRIGGQDAPEFE